MIFETWKHFFIPVRDGIKLSTYVQFPKGHGPWPVILSRTPYSNILPVWKDIQNKWAEHGYVFIVQECRGTGKSEGEWTPFIYEKNDGLDTIDWIIKQDWMDGNIATYGASYSGVVQWMMAEDLPTEVKTMFISVTGIERYRQNYMNGMFRHDIYTVWAIGNSGIQPKYPHKNLYDEALKIKPHIEMDYQLFGKQLPWYRDWVTNIDSQSSYWSTGLWAELKEIPRKTNIPIMMVAGWFDHNLDASIQSYKKLPQSIRDDSIFIIGPWVHTEGVSGDLSYPNHDKFGEQQFDAALQWFNHHLKEKEFEMAKERLITYTIGEGNWRSWSGWMKEENSVCFYLKEINGKVGELTLNSKLSAGKVTYYYNPDNPVPTKGGAAIMSYLTGNPNAAPPASVIQDKMGTRGDVISFISEPLDEDLEIAGKIRANLFVSSNAEDTSFTIAVMEMFPDGTSYNIRDGITCLRYRNNKHYHYNPEDIVMVEIDCWPITWTVKKCSRLRVDISSSNFPAYHAHPNIADVWACQKETKIAKQVIHFGVNYPSCIEIPVTHSGL
ncbi:CocE/NonD family hydrolase [Bacillus sp. FJAT-49711]|uniref:CocE/NonD family hydrolase n=1 Tax=Bacillus sp. FJAT-49711 TaxID=2833585 RepID=UPI001BC96557|nr:CocE/NonD family hydrolase [Bacillus sp. FJAT-49711]MBS4218047.1 CocE/NonD family hydrolase [Bacillus sp. FJAT-49711]